MRNWTKITFCAGILAFSANAVAQPQIDPTAERLKQGILFQGILKTPNELDPAVTPYFECVMANAKAKRVDSAEVEIVPLVVTPTSCGDLRKAAQLKADVQLKSMGIKNAADREIIIGNTLLAIDLMAQSNATWMERAK